MTSEISPRLVDEVIDRAGCREQRRRLLPARTAVYFVLGLCLCSAARTAWARHRLRAALDQLAMVI